MYYLCLFGQVLSRNSLGDPNIKLILIICRLYCHRRPVSKSFYNTHGSCKDITFQKSENGPALLYNFFTI